MGSRGEKPPKFNGKVGDLLATPIVADEKVLLKLTTCIESVRTH